MQDSAGRLTLVRADEAAEEGVGLTEDEVEAPKGFTRFALAIDIAVGFACRVHLHFEHDRGLVQGRCEEDVGLVQGRCEEDVGLIQGRCEEDVGLIQGRCEEDVGEVGGSPATDVDAAGTTTANSGDGTGMPTTPPLWMPGTSANELTSLFIDGLAVISANTSRASGGKDPAETTRDLKKRLATGALVRMLPPSSTVGRVNELLTTRNRSPAVEATGDSGQGSVDVVEILRKKHWLSVYLDRPSPFDIDSNLL
jgi:hypothetical protein